MKQILIVGSGLSRALVRWFHAGDVDNTMGIPDCLDVVAIYGVKHIFREPIVWPLTHGMVSLDSSILFLSNLSHELLAVQFPKSREHGDGKRIKNVRLTRVVTQQ